MPKGKRATVGRPRSRRRPGRHPVLELVRSARQQASRALEGLRREIAATRSRLEDLLKEERDFVVEVSGRAVSAVRGVMPQLRRRKPGQPKRRGPAKADRFFAKLPGKFTLEDARKVAGRLTGISLAQWSRAKKIRKVGNGYAKVGAK